MTTHKGPFFKPIQRRDEMEKENEFVSIAEIAKNNRGTRGGHYEVTFRDGITMTMRKGHSKKEGEGNYKNRITFCIGQDLIKEVRFLAGDKVDILFNAENRKGMVLRISSTDKNDRGAGYSIGRSGGSKSASRNQEVSMTWYPGMPIVKQKVKMENIQVVDGSIHFSFPEEVVFETCPHGHTLGEDTEKKPECDNCAIWEECIERKAVE